MSNIDCDICPMRNKIDKVTEAIDEKSSEADSGLTRSGNLKVRLTYLVWLPLLACRSLTINPTLSKHTLIGFAAGSSVPRLPEASGYEIFQTYFVFG